MNPDTFNMEIRKFLKRVGVSSQREIESAVREALEKGELRGQEVLKVSMTLKIDDLNKTFVVQDEIGLE
jgi:ribosomal protein L1